MNFAKQLIGAAAFVLFASQAQAVNAPLWACDLDGDLSGRRVSLLIGVQNLDGTGTLTCHSLVGDALKEIPVQISMRGFGVGLGLARIDNAKIVGLGVGVMKDPENLAETYKVGASAGLNLFRAGFDADVAFSLSSQGREGAGFEVGLTGLESRGLDVQVAVRKVEITAIK